MKRNQTSITALGIAVLRAYESERPANERVCYDPFARRFVGSLFYNVTKFFLASGYAEWRGPGVAGFLAARCRYIDDYLRACLAEGLEQLVILGAGYDSRAYRTEGLAGRVRVFEVDHPATQADKIAKVRKILGQLPEYVTYVPIDFTRESLAERLCASGYDRRLKTLFIWEGVTYYIGAEAVDSTLATITGNARPGSSVIFDYTSPTVISGAAGRGEVASMRRSSRFTGEGMVFGIDPAEIRPFLESRGFVQVVSVTGEQLHAMYFTGANARRKVAPVYAIVHATVRPAAV